MLDILTLVSLFYNKPTSKNFLDDPSLMVPYFISVCLARSSADSIGATILSIVKNAARLAVYVEMIINTKNHQTVPIIRPDIDLYIYIYVYSKYKYDRNKR